MVCRGVLRRDAGSFGIVGDVGIQTLECCARAEACDAPRRHVSVEYCCAIKIRTVRYMMVGVDVKLLAFDNDVLFCEKLYEEESVQVLPGVVFQYPNFFRLVPCAPAEILGDACERIAAFCGRHVRAE
jgi:aspartate/methionine/tyrosine aminotransferase